MFTGIIDHEAPVRSLELAGSGKLIVDTQFADISEGESIAINGVCLTATQASSQGELHAYVSPETLSKTNMESLKPDSYVNVERALRANQRLSGHIVQGHIDGTGRIVKIEKEQESHRIELETPYELGRYCVEKGSIAVDGVSLTINSLIDQKRPNPKSRETPETTNLSFTIIPHTWEATHFHRLVLEQRINIEVDPMAKHLERLCHPYLKLLRP